MQRLPHLKNWEVFSCSDDSLLTCPGLPAHSDLIGQGQCRDCTASESRSLGPAVGSDLASLAEALCACQQGPEWPHFSWALSPGAIRVAMEVAWRDHLAWVLDPGEKLITAGCYDGIEVIVPTLQAKKQRP